MIDREKVIRGLEYCAEGSLSDCEECPHTGMGCSEHLCADALALLKAQEPRWIPATDAEKLPKQSTPCLVACNQWGGERVRKATFLASDEKFYERGVDITEYVTHWMARPEPPKEEENESL